MLYLTDKPKENWSWASNDYQEVIYEDGSRQPLTTSSVQLTFWEKYKGMKLSDVSNSKDLEWLLKVAREKKDVFATEMFIKRLRELT